MLLKLILIVSKLQYYQTRAMSKLRKTLIPYQQYFMNLPFRCVADLHDQLQVVIQDFIWEGAALRGFWGVWNTQQGGGIRGGGPGVYDLYREAFLTTLELICQTCYVLNIKGRI